MKDFQKNSVIMILLTTLSSGINYLCQIVMGRVMSFTTFGVMNSMFSLILVLNVPGTSVNMLTARGISQNRDDKNVYADISSEIFRLSAWIAGVMLLVMLLVCIPGGQVFDVSPVVLLLTGMAAAAGMFPFIISGIFTGEGMFLRAGLFSLIVPLVKTFGILISTLILSELTQQIIVMGAIILGNCLASIAFYKTLFPLGLCRKSAGKKCGVMNHTSLLVMASNLFYLLFSNGDIFLVTIYFGSEQAGIYSASMLFGRILFFFTTALVSVLLPYVSQADGAGKSVRGVFVRALAMTLGVSFICIIPINCFPEFFIGFLYGSRYLEAVSFVPYSCMVAIVVSLVNLELNYLIGVGKERRIAIHLAFAFVMLLVISYFLRASIQILLLGLLGVLTGVFVFELPICLGKPRSALVDVDGRKNM